MSRDALLYVVARESRFTEIDRDVLAGRWPVRDWVGRHPVRSALAAVRAVWGCRAVIAWFAGWHAFVPVTAAWALRRPSVVITGGYDVASVPEAGYGMQRSFLGRRVSRWVLARATHVMANSEFGAQEARRAVDRPVSVVHHGVPDLVGALPTGTRSGALTVGVVDAANLERKGLLPFAHAARELPDVEFVIAGPLADDAAAARLSEAGPVELLGRVSDQELGERYATASVYVQASRHEGFGMSVAEAMLGGCVPVVSDQGALPEVVGDAGVVVPLDGLVEGIRRALAADDAARARARERVLERFTLEQRAAGLCRVVEEALGERSAAGGAAPRP